MTTAPDDDSRFADMVDELLEQLLNGQGLELGTLAARHPQAAHRIDEAIALAGGVAGRRDVTRPSLHGYEIVREIGRGGMGTVYLARQTSLARDVALKVLPHAFGLTLASRQRFLEEARALAQVKHEHIVDIHRVIDDGELLAFEMEFVDGPSLQVVLDALRQQRDAAKGPPGLAHVAECIGLPVGQLGARNLTQFFVRMMLKVARALAAVHAAGFVHRDVKPANVILRRNGEPVLVDFGLVRENSPDITRVGSFAGTPVYSSPEQLRGDAPAGPGSDVYSLGVTLYECLTLATPFVGRTTTDLLLRIEKGNLPPLRRLAPDAPRDLETIVAHAMELAPERRYRDAGAFADDLQRLLELQPIAARPVGPLRRLGKFLRRNQKSLLAAGTGALLVGALLLPMVHAARAESRDLGLAEQHVRMARQHLVSIDSLRPMAGPTRGSHLDSSRRRALQDALAEYERALALVPSLDPPARERDVVRMAIWLQQLTVTQADSLQGAFASREYRELAERLPPLTLLAARQLAGATPIDASQFDGATIDKASDDDRLGLGLLAFLFGDFGLCERSWESLAADRADQPLVDAGLGRLSLADGMPEAAQARLLQAQRHFPTSATLALELAETALRSGNVMQARQWMAKLAPDPAAPAARRRLEIDLRAASDGSADLTKEYAALVAEHPDDVVSHHRLAQLAMRRGDLARAEQLLDEQLARWPNAAALRLDRARLALQRRDLPAYAAQVLAVLDQDFGRGGSRGTAADLLEILRIGGLTRLYGEGLAAIGGERTGRAFLGGEIPIRGFVPPRVAAQCEDLLRYLHRVQQRTRALRGADSPFDELAANLFVTLPVAMQQLPNTGAPLGLQARTALALVPWAARALYPTCRALWLQTTVRAGIGAWRPVELTMVDLPDAVPAELRGQPALLAIDDVTGDGLADVLVGMPSRHPERAAGSVMVVDGRTAAVLATLNSDSENHMFGNSLAAIADHDGDGARDWLLGAPSGAATQRHGQAEIWSSATRQPLAILEGDEPGFGVSVCELGDCDGDGRPDFAIATPPILRNTAAQGSVRIFSAGTRAVLHTLRNDVAGVWFGACITNAGDTDGDGTADLLVGGNFGGAPGLVRLYSGRSGAALQTWADPSPTSGFGCRVSGLPDVDGDGHRDVLIAAVRQDGKGDRDQVFVFSGHGGRQLAVMHGNQPGAGFGSVVLPYASNRGQLALLVGVPFGQPGTGGAFEFLATSGQRISSLAGPGAQAGFGSVGAALPDSDGDGWPELLAVCQHQNGAAVIRIPSAQLPLGWLRR